MNWLERYFIDNSEFFLMCGWLLILALTAWATRYITSNLLRRILGQIRRRSAAQQEKRLRQGLTGTPHPRRHIGRFSQSLFDDRVLERAARIAPSLMVQLGIELVPYLPATPMLVIRNVAFALTIFHTVRTITMLFAVMVERSAERDSSHNYMAFKSISQLLSIALYCGAAIIIVASLIGRSPVVVLSSLGALSAVLMLVCKDTILSFTAGILISSNDMLRVGDWIEMPQAGADGDVIDIALHTVKVQNWDRTITTIPTWKLVSESYKNWRGMAESGGRRIKRSVRIDAGTVRFLNSQELADFSRIDLIHDYLQGKIQDIEATTAEERERLGELASLQVNQPRLTNIGTFRAYALAYLKNHPGIHKDMTLMVRQMEPTAEGIPMEVYCFTNVTAWVLYENIQGDIFDHLLAVLPELGLRAFQNPSGSDMRTMFEGFHSETVQTALQAPRNQKNQISDSGRNPEIGHQAAEGV